MFRSALLLAFRNLVKSKSFSFINIFGLAVGLTCFSLIFLWVESDLGYDRCFERAERIHRIVTDVHLRSGQTKLYAYTTSQMAAVLKAEYPEVEAATRIRPIPQALLRKGEKSFFESGFVFTDPDFFGVFSIPVISGDPAEALKAPNSLLLTREMASKYFGNEDPIGQTLLFNNRTEFKVTGILGDMPANTHIHPQFVAWPGEVEVFERVSWSALSIYTYVRIGEGVDEGVFEERVQEMATKYVGPRGRELFHYRLQPLTSIHLHSDREGEFAHVTSVMQIYLLSAVAVLVLLVACFNFVNLSTARSGRRAREVGMRKVLGALRRDLGLQFVGESLLSAMIAFLISLGMVKVLTPFMNTMTEVPIGMDPAFDLPILLGTALLAGLLSGIYPALVLSAFHPAVVFRGVLRKGPSGLFIRKAMIVCQFSATIALLIATGVVYRQMRYVKQKNLGFDKEQVLLVRVRNADAMRGYEGIKQELLVDPGVLSAAASSSLPGLPVDQNAYVPEGFGDNPLMVLTMFVDHDFIPLMGMELVEGRNFSRDFSTDTLTAYVINQAAQARFGWSDPIGKPIFCTNRGEDESTAQGTVIGVVKDFHVRSLHQDIEPLVMRIHPDRLYFINLRLRTENLSRTMGYIENKLHEFQPDYPFEYSFLDSRFERLYRNEKRLERIFMSFALIAVFIACLGLFGLAAYTTEQRTREIGIRRVLGASGASIIWLLTREFSKWVALSNLIAWPVAYLVMRKWLQNFSYRVEVGGPVLILSGLTALVIAVLTVSFQAAKAAAADPVASLRHE